MADYSQLMSLEKKAKPHLPQASLQREKQENIVPSANQQPVSTSHQPSLSQSTERTMGGLTGQSTHRSTIQSTNQIVEKPKAFYITKRLDHRLDEAVRYIQDRHGIKKVDRSILVNAIMDNDASWTEEALDLLVNRIINLLTSRLMK